MCEIKKLLSVFKVAPKEGEVKQAKKEMAINIPIEL